MDAAIFNLNVQGFQYLPIPVILTVMLIYVTNWYLYSYYCNLIA